MVREKARRVEKAMTEHNGKVVDFPHVRSQAGNPANLATLAALYARIAVLTDELEIRTRQINEILERMGLMPPKDGNGPGSG